MGKGASRRLRINTRGTIPARGLQGCKRDRVGIQDRDLRRVGPVPKLDLLVVGRRMRSVLVSAALGFRRREMEFVRFQREMKRGAERPEEECGDGQKGSAVLELHAALLVQNPGAPSSTK
ncbi:MAG: hypothetical protein HYY17_16185 [Planctomycetes bacterium]|nr:hypothetical protein [Planctomycetota bacterium]